MAKEQVQQRLPESSEPPESEEVRALKAQLAEAQARLATLEAPAAVASPPPPQQVYRFKHKKKGDVEYPTNRFRIVAPRYIVPNPAKPYAGFFHDADPKKPIVLELPEGFILDDGFVPVTEGYAKPLPAHAGTVEQRVNIMSAARVQSLPMDDAGRPAPSGFAPGLTPSLVPPGFPEPGPTRASDREI